MSLSLHDTIRRLEAYNNSPSPILTVYLHIPKEKTDLSVTLQTLLNKQLSEDQKKELVKNIEYIDGFLQEYHKKKTEQTLVFFSGGNNLFEVIRFPYPMPDKVAVSHSPDISDLLSELTDYRRFLAVFFDRKKAIYFTVVDGVLEDKQEIIDQNVPQNVHQNAEETMHNQREDKINRHIQQHIDRHLSRVVEEMTRFLHNRPVIGIVLGGHQNLMHSFIGHLPTWMKKRIVGEIPSELNVDINVLVTETNHVIEHANKKFNQEENAYITQ